MTPQHPGVDGDRGEHGDPTAVQEIVAFTFRKIELTDLVTNKTVSFDFARTRPSRRTAGTAASPSGARAHFSFATAPRRRCP